LPLLNKEIMLKGSIKESFAFSHMYSIQNGPLIRFKEHILRLGLRDLYMDRISRRISFGKCSFSGAVLEVVLTDEHCIFRSI